MKKQGPPLCNAFYADVPYQLIHSVRLIHALMESGYRVHIPTEHLEKFSRIKEVFGVKFAVGVDSVPRLSPLEVDHEQPRTSVGRIHRPLIWPHAVVRRCRSLWPNRRDVRFSFAGLVTTSRKQALGRWLKATISHTRPQLHANIVEAGPGLVSLDNDRVVFWSSSRGRHFPGKSWDDDYHQLLANSRFVLCPSGKYSWTYRFFEAALCGAVPVIEKVCPAYEGFYFRMMDEPVGNWKWRKDHAQHNYETCRDLLTVPRDSLTQEIARLLAADTGDASGLNPLPQAQATSKRQI